MSELDLGTGEKYQPYAFVFPLPRRRYATTSHQGLDLICEGPALDLDGMLAFALGSGEPDENLGIDGYDLAVWEDNKLAAIIHHREGRKPSVTRLGRPRD